MIVEKAQAYSFSKCEGIFFHKEFFPTFLGLAFWQIENKQCFAGAVSMLSI